MITSKLGSGFDCKRLLGCCQLLSPACNFGLPSIHQSGGSARLWLRTKILSLGATLGLHIDAGDETLLRSPLELSLGGMRENHAQLALRA